MGAFHCGCSSITSLATPLTSSLALTKKCSPCLYMHYPNDSVVKYRPRETFSPSPPLGRYEQLMSHFPQDLDIADESALDPVLRFLRPSCCPMVRIKLTLDSQ